MRRRIMMLALIALVVPFPALAIDGGGVKTSSGPGTLNVSASLAGCGLASAQIMCQINAGWNSLEGAENYSVSVTSADGSVIDAGSVSGQGTSVWVPYAGSGTYTVSVTAWGTPPGEEDDGTPEVIARSTSDEGNGDVAARVPPETSGGGELRTNEPTAPVTDDSLTIDDGTTETRDVTCEEPVAEEPPPAPPEAAADAEAQDKIIDAREAADTIPVDDDCSS